MSAPEPNPFLASIRSKYFEEFKQAKQTEGKQARAEAVTALKERVMAELIPDPHGRRGHRRRQVRRGLASRWNARRFAT